MERKRSRGARLVGCYRAGARRRQGEDVLDSVIGTCVKMATGARGPAIAAGLRVPEKGLAESDERGLIFDVPRNVGRLGDRHLLKRNEASTSALPQRHRGEANQMGKVFASLDLDSRM